VVYRSDKVVRNQNITMVFVIVLLSFTLLVGADAGYQVKTSQGYCKHSDGKHLSRCYKTHTNLCMTLKDACEEACESSNSCVGYDIGSSNLGEQCSLFPSSLSFTTCPTGYTFEETKYNGINHVPSSMAETSEDLVNIFFKFRPSTPQECYAKID